MQKINVGKKLYKLKRHSGQTLKKNYFWAFSTIKIDNWNFSGNDFKWFKVL